MENLLLVIMYLILLLAIFCIFNARGIVKGKVSCIKENKYVKFLKGVFTIVAVVSLAIIVYI